MSLFGGPKDMKGVRNISPVQSTDLKIVKFQVSTNPNSELL